MKEKVLVALSGGVDSAVCAYLLREQGFEVECAMMRLHDGHNMSAEIDAAAGIAKNLNLPFHELDYRCEFKEHVIEYFTSTYIDGKTPNPCIECNRHLKFGMFMRAADDLDCDKIATGHYAQIICDTKSGKYKLLRAADKNKDQSYVLYFLSQKQLSKIMFPLGSMHKSEIRKIAKEINLPCANKPESQDICFVENEKYAEYVSSHSIYKPKPGNITDMHGNVVGTHKGLISYTIGQRKGIDVAFGKPMYVSQINVDTNTLVMGTRDECMRDAVELTHVSWIAGAPPSIELEASVKLRYRQPDKPCEIFVDKKNSKRIKINLRLPQDGITPGQFGVIYDGEEVLGGGVIK